MESSMRGLPVHHQLLEFTKIHVHWVSDAIQPSHPLSSSSPPAFDLSQHQGLFQWVHFASGGQIIGVSASASVLPMNIRDWFPLGWTDWFFFLSKGLSRVFSNTTTNIQYQQLQVNQRPSSKGRIYFSCAWNWEWALFLLSWTDAIEVKLCNIQCYVIKSNMTFPAPPW